MSEQMTDKQKELARKELKNAREHLRQCEAALDEKDRVVEFHPYVGAAGDGQFGRISHADMRPFIGSTPYVIVSDKKQTVIDGEIAKEYTDDIGNTVYIVRKK